MARRKKIKPKIADKEATKVSQADEVFILECLKNLDKVAAFKKAFKADHLAKTTISANANRHFNQPHIQNRIAEAQRSAAVTANYEYNVSAKDILKQLNVLRTSQIDDYIDLVKDPKTGFRQLEFKPFDELTKEQLSCIESVKTGRNGIELKLHGKDWTIDKIAKHIGFYGEHNYQKTSGSLTPEERKQRLEELSAKMKKAE